jgi:hypothetical protein
MRYYEDILTALGLVRKLAAEREGSQGLHLSKGGIVN